MLPKYITVFHLYLKIDTTFKKLTVFHFSKATTLQKRMAFFLFLKLQSSFFKITVQYFNFKRYKDQK